MTQIELIDHRVIFEDPQNPRKEFNKEAITELANNIKEVGLLQPITVRPFPENKIQFPKYLSGKLCRESLHEQAVKIELKHEDTYLKRKESIDNQIKAIKQG